MRRILVADLQFLVAVIPIRALTVSASSFRLVACQATFATCWDITTRFVYLDATVHHCVVVGGTVALDFAYVPMSVRLSVMLNFVSCFLSWSLALGKERVLSLQLLVDVN